eukprot:571849-Prymnesium_polylepis.1
MAWQNRSMCPVIVVNGGVNSRVATLDGLEQSSKRHARGNRVTASCPSKHWLVSTDVKII